MLTSVILCFYTDLPYKYKTRSERLERITNDTTKL